MRFDTKVAVILRADLAVWQKVNVAAFTVSGIAAAPGATGEPYLDASGVSYLPMLRQPILVFAADAAALRRAYERARARNLRFAIYTAELFATGHDEANRAAVRAAPSAALDLVGLALCAERRDVDKVVKGLALHG